MRTMKMIDIRRMDLNLLVAFEAIYEEGSVTQASERLHLTQSALSHGKSCETRERFFLCHVEEITRSRR